MVKRFSGFDFWEQRCKALESSRGDDYEGQKRLSDAVNTSDNESTDEPALVVAPAALPQTIEPKDDFFEPDPIVVKKVRGVRHTVSISVAPLLLHSSQSALMSPHTSEDQEKIPSPTSKTCNNGEVALSHHAINHSRTRPYSLPTERPPRPSLRVDTNNLSATRHFNQRQSMPPMPSFPEAKVDYIASSQHHRETSESPSDCAKHLSREMDKAFEDLTKELHDSQCITAKDTNHYRTWNPDLDRVSAPLRPSIPRKPLRNSGQWAQKQIHDSAVSSMPNHSPMMPIKSFANNERQSLAHVKPMDYNLDDGLHAFLRWDTKHMSIFGFEMSPQVSG
ncbi:hypothetical protein AK830_g7 [Neonectria ditissima]|uniref:Uncharacterized protein n=1 Tax=Neonectria ditissima TaxID=78410 RepID=A0A0P7BQJ7_9HYPO|nr:hypothetical protein AK830_g7 [Neonectria ditissima]